MKIDSHQHFWNYDAARHDWISPEMRAIRKDFSPADLEPILRSNGFDGCVAVQVDQTLEETRYLLELSERHQFIRGVVGWVDLRAKDLEQTLAQLRHPALKGFRAILQGQPRGVMTNPEFISGVNLLRRHGYTYDLLIYHHQFEEALEFLNATDGCRIVLDHLGKPSIRTSKILQWARDVKVASKHENVFCKLSGMVTEADWKQWRKEDLWPFIDVVFQSFGPERIMYGSDWPVCLVAASYEQQLEVVTSYISRLSPVERDMVMGENAKRFYNLE